MEKAFNKVVLTINSCTNLDHLQVCKNLVENFGLMYGKEFEYLILINHLEKGIQN